MIFVFGNMVKRIIGCVGIIDKSMCCFTVKKIIYINQGSINCFRCTIRNIEP